MSNKTKEHLSRHLTNVSNNITFLNSRNASQNLIDMYRRLRITLADKLGYNDNNALIEAIRIRSY